jgi:hypothetical protein
MDVPLQREWNVTGRPRREIPFAKDNALNCFQIVVLPSSIRKFPVFNDTRVSSKKREPFGISITKIEGEVITDE